jgi:orotate phosphoribosyltransferase
MQDYKKQFIDFLITNQALQFGDFTLKSGRQSPYFINTGVFDTGQAIAKLGYFYAALIKEEFGNDFDVIFGPAYKGISLAVAAVIALHQDFNLNKFYTFNRKEIKDHGDKKITVGHKLTDGDKLIMIDDVTTDGTTKFETVELINKLAKVEYKGLVVAVNRQEKTAKGIDAFKNIEDRLGFPVKAVVSICEILEYLTNKEINNQIYLTQKKAGEIKNYLKEYGI